MINGRTGPNPSIEELCQYIAENVQYLKNNTNDFYEFAIFTKFANKGEKMSYCFRRFADNSIGLCSVTCSGIDEKVTKEIFDEN